MKVSILGGAGFLGRKVVVHLARQGRLGDRPITSVTLFDLAAPPTSEAAFPIVTVAGDLVDLPPEAVPPGTEVVFHLHFKAGLQNLADQTGQQAAVTGQLHPVRAGSSDQGLGPVAHRRVTVGGRTATPTRRAA